MRKPDHAAKVTSLFPIFAALKPIPFAYRLLSYIWPIHLDRRKSAHNRQLDVDIFLGKVMLNTRRANYSFGRLHVVMQKALKSANDKGCEFRNVLMLGYGGGSAAQVIRETYHAGANITAVEIDAEVVAMAKKWFYAENIDFKITDAFDYIQSCDKQFDTIICDIFRDVYMPDQSKTAAFYEECAALLSPGGIFIQNLMIPANEREKQFRLFSGIYRNAEMSLLFGTNTIFTGIR